MAREPFAEQLTTKWVGAAFYWVLHGCRGKYSDLLHRKYDTRNLWTGYIINIIVLVVLLYIFFIKKI